MISFAESMNEIRSKKNCVRLTGARNLSVQRDISKSVNSFIATATALFVRDCLSGTWPWGGQDSGCSAVLDGIDFLTVS